MKKLILHHFQNRIVLSIEDSYEKHFLQESLKNDIKTVFVT